MSISPTITSKPSGLKSSGISIGTRTGPRQPNAPADNLISHHRIQEIVRSPSVLLLPHGYPDTTPERAVVEGASCRFVDGDSINKAELLTEMANADAVLVRWTNVDAATIQQLNRCQVLVRYGAGYDNVDLAAATTKGIVVSYVPEYCIDEVSTHAISLLLASIRRLREVHNRVAAGKWEPNPPETLYRLRGRTLGIVGLGNIGREVARKLSTWGVRILAFDPYITTVKHADSSVKLVDLRTLCADSDYITLHQPLLPETRHFCDASFFAACKRRPIFINTARGPLVDEKALLHALSSGMVSAAALDVFENEPLPSSSPLNHHPKIILSDHMAWYSEESHEELRTTAAKNALALLQGRLPPAIANPSVLGSLSHLPAWPGNPQSRWRERRDERPYVRTL